MAHAGLSHEPPEFNHQLLSNVCPYKYYCKEHPPINMFDYTLCRVSITLFS